MFYETLNLSKIDIFTAYNFIMYEVFVGDKPIVLTDKVELESDFKNYLLKIQL